MLSDQIDQAHNSFVLGDVELHGGLAACGVLHYDFRMTTVEMLRPQALALSQRERAELACILLESLPPHLDDEDEGVAEALRREAEFDADPSTRMTPAEFELAIKAGRGK